MTFLQIAFYFFAAVMVFAATMVITMRNPVKSALFLVLAFFSAACVWLTLEAEFLAIVMVLVYVGAVMVLFLFVVMMLDINLARLRAGFTDYLPIGGLVALLMVAELVFILSGDSFSMENLPRPESLGEGHSNTRELGSVLYTFYVYPFEIAALILLVAIIAAIALTLRKRPDTKYVNPADQVSVRREDRVRIVKMPAERRSVDRKVEDEGGAS
jgi:NADH-quinone oxidoreductase subunit J